MISAGRVAVTNAAVALNTANPSNWQRLTIKNVGATDAADLGTSAVTAGTGFALAVGATVAVELPPGDVLFAISTLAGTSLSVLRI